MSAEAELRYVHVEHVMGTTVSIDIRDHRTALPAVHRLLRWLHEVDRTFSTYREDSAISRINLGHLRRQDAGPLVTEVLERCDDLRVRTNGYFDARAGGHLDPSALVKGWAVQVGADGLTDDGLENFCLCAGGDVVTRGERAPGRPWRIGIQHPRDRLAVAAVVEARDLAVATSGCYERGQHIIDPHTGRPPAGLSSVTVCGPDLGTADALSTAAFAMGPAATDWTTTLAGYEAMLILDEDTVLTSPGFPRAEALQ